MVDADVLEVARDLEVHLERVERLARRRRRAGGGAHDAAACREVDAAPIAEPADAIDEPLARGVGLEKKFDVEAVDGGVGRVVLHD
eukprot:6636197-Prymnesium_polylepis.1